MFNKIKRLTKQTYYSELLESFKNDIKNTWKSIRTLIGRTPDKTTICDTFRFNNTVLTDSKVIADEFCKKITYIGPEYASAIPNARKSFDQYLQSRTMKSIFFAPTDPVEIARLITSLKNKKSCGHDKY